MNQIAPIFQTIDTSRPVYEAQAQATEVTIGSALDALKRDLRFYLTEMNCLQVAGAEESFNKTWDNHVTDLLADCMEAPIRGERYSRFGVQEADE